MGTKRPEINCNSCEGRKWLCSVALLVWKSLWAQEEYLHQVNKNNTRHFVKEKLIPYLLENSVIVLVSKSRKSKDIPVAVHGGPQGCERLRLLHYLDKWLIDGGKVVSPMHWPHVTPRFLYLFFFFKIPGSHFC
jgi:hypothetical protein